MKELQFCIRSLLNSSLHDLVHTLKRNIHLSMDIKMKEIPKINAPFQPLLPVISPHLSHNFSLPIKYLQTAVKTNH